MHPIEQSSRARNIDQENPAIRSSDLKSPYAILAVLMAFCVVSASAEPVPVRYAEGSARGLLALRNMDGVLLASGDLRQLVRHGVVTSRLTFHFKDGSIDDETTVFSQRSQFRLVSDHHVQRGPSFPHPFDMTVNVATGMVTTKTSADGKEKTDTHHMDIPPDVVNGLVLNVIKNIPPNTGETKVSLLAAGTKPRVVKLVISPEGEEAFSAAGFTYKARRFLIKIELGGIAGVVAPLIGKNPSDVHVWIMDGAPPVLLKIEGQLYENGPIWRIDLTGPVWRTVKQ